MVMTLVVATLPAVIAVCSSNTCDGLIFKSMFCLSVQSKIGEDYEHDISFK